MKPEFEPLWPKWLKGGIVWGILTKKPDLNDPGLLSGIN